MIDEGIGDDALKDALGHLRTPRQLFKVLHRLFEEHCHRHTEDAPLDHRPRHLPTVLSGPPPRP